MGAIRVIPPTAVTAPTHEILFADLGLPDMPNDDYNVDLLSEDGIGFDIDWDSLTAQGFTLINIAGNTTVRGTVTGHGATNTALDFVEHESSTTRDIFFDASRVDGEPGSPVAIVKTLIAAPFTQTNIVGYFQAEGMQQQAKDVWVENSTPSMQVLTADLGAAKACTYTIGGVVYYEAGRIPIGDGEVTLVHLSTIATS